MKLLQRVAFIGNYLPRRCGIATFTQDLHRAVSTARPDLETCVVAMTDSDRTYDYPPLCASRFTTKDRRLCQGSRVPEQRGIRRCFPSTRYGIFGGEAGWQYHRTPIAPRNAGLSPTAHGACQTDSHPARRDAPDHRYFGKNCSHVGKRSRISPFRS